MKNTWTLLLAFMILVSSTACTVVPFCTSGSGSAVDSAQDAETQRLEELGITPTEYQEQVTQPSVTARRFESTGGFSSTVHVLSSEKGNILIDPGHYSEELAAYVESIGGLNAILITHGHWDNIHALDEAVAANPDTEVYIHELDIPFLRDPHLNCSDINGFSLLVDTLPAVFVEGVQEIGGYVVEVIHSPGHTCGSCMFYFRDENILFGGDTIMATTVGSAAHPTGSEEERTATIEMFKERDFPDDMKVLSGHGEDTVYADLMQSNADLQ